MAVEQNENPPGYPVETEADVVLTDGGIGHLRPIRPADAAALVAFYDRVSPESKYLRFFAPYPKLSDSDVARFTEVDYVDRLALVVTVGDQIIGVGRFDRTERSEAEVAFLIEDAHQGRGIGQLLLEHLAQAARERGITAFVAEVLPQNRRMAQVFVDAGYRVSHGFDDGVMSFVFPILPTDTSVGVMERREHRAEKASLRRLLTPTRVVVQGQGERVQGVANRLLSGGFRGHVVALPTDGARVNGVTNITSMTELSEPVDLVVVSVPTTELGAVVIDAAHQGAHALVVLTANVSVSDNHTVVNLARAYGLRALGPDSLGLINTDPAVALNASPGPMPRPGGVGVFCQSAAVGVALLNDVVRHRVGLSSFISTGDYADITGNDVMQFWEDDDATRVAVLSIDAIGNPRKFSRITRRLTRRKPVVVFAPGGTSRSSYAGARSGLRHAPDEAVDALFRQAGVMVVHRRGAMFDIAKVAARQPLPQGPRVQIITNSLTLAGQLQQTADALGLLTTSSPPIMVDPMGEAQQFVDAAASALAGDTCDSVMCAAVSVFQAGTAAQRVALESVAAESTKPILGVFLDFGDADDSVLGPDRVGGLPTFTAPTDALQALSALTAYAHWRDRDPGAVPDLNIDEPAAKRLAQRIVKAAPRGGELSDREATELLATVGLHLVPQHHVTTLEQACEVGASLGWNVVLKASAAAVRGRLDLASVYRHIDDEDDMAQAWSDLGELVGELGLGQQSDLSVAVPVVQQMVPPGVALAVTSREDAAFGPMVSLGLDGIASELLGDIVYRVPPLTTVDAAAMVRDLKAAPTLFGRHGRPGVDIASVEDLLHRVAQLADAVPQLASVALNPCVASAGGVAVLGARIFVTPTDDLRDPLARTL